jgi:hypothetical protein
VKLAGRSVPTGKSFHIDKEVIADETERINFERCLGIVVQRMYTPGNPHS